MKIPNGKLEDAAISEMSCPSLVGFLALSFQWPLWAPSTLQGGVLTHPQSQEGKGEPFFLLLFFFSFLFFFFLPVIVEPLRREFMCVIICVVIGSLAYESLTKLTEVSFGEKCNQLLHSDTLQQINSYCLYGFRLSWLMVSSPKQMEEGANRQGRVKSPRDGGILKYLSQ